MVMKLSDVQELFTKRIFNQRVVSKEFPQHLAISTQPFKPWIDTNKSDLTKACEKHKSLIIELIEWQIKKDLPILTINLPQSDDEYKAYLKDLLIKLKESSLVKDNQIRIFVVGKWYDLNPSIVDSIKDIMNFTHDYDRFFLNLCVNYNGQDEIGTALKLMARKIDAEKLQLDDISREIIKDNLFTSYFLPPQVMVESGYSYSGTLLWDTQGAVMHFTKKHWLDFDKKDLDAAIVSYNEYQKNQAKTEEPKAEES